MIMINDSLLLTTGYKMILPQSICNTIVLLLAVLFTAVVSGESCPNGYKTFNETNNEIKCVKVCFQNFNCTFYLSLMSEKKLFFAQFIACQMEMPLTDAQAYCSFLGGHLLEICNAEKFFFMEENLNAVAGKLVSQ